jgi:hypothetical protein
MMNALDWEAEAVEIISEFWRVKTKFKVSVAPAPSETWRIPSSLV